MTATLPGVQTTVLNLNVSPFEPAWKRWTFPGGEVGIILQNPPDRCPDVLQARINTPAQLIELILASDALKNLYGTWPLTLRIGYMPYARQDRYDIPGSSFSLYQILKIIANLGYRTIEVLDPHSKVMSEHCVRVKTILPDPYFLNYSLNIQGRLAMVIPDKGANVRCRGMAAAAGIPPGDIIQCLKNRDPLTGKLCGFSVETKKSVEWYDSIDAFIVADDIADGCGTFLGLVDALAIEGDVRGKLHLWATHGIFSNNALSRLGVFNSIGCTNSWQNFSEDTRRTHKLTVVPFFA